MTTTTETLGTEGITHIDYGDRPLAQRDSGGRTEVKIFNPVYFNVAHPPAWLYGFLVMGLIIFIIGLIGLFFSKGLQKLVSLVAVCGAIGIAGAALIEIRDWDKE